MANGATQIVYWPGQTTFACDAHAEKLKSLGNILGFTVSSTPCDPTTLMCSNCFNDEMKAAIAKGSE